MNTRGTQENRPVLVQYFKYPDTLHWRHDLIHLGEDSHGVWLGAPVGTVIQRGHEPSITMDRAFVQLIPPKRWWTALFNTGHRTEIYVDITTVATWPAADRVEMVDLDLDVIRLTDGQIYIVDEDEFEDHKVSLGYPPKLIDGARAAAARVRMDLERSAPPFDGTATSWLDRIA